MNKVLKMLHLQKQHELNGIKNYKAPQRNFKTVFNELH